jgi:hypothetical protein
MARKMSNKGAPPSNEQMSHIIKARPDILVGKPIMCSKCKQGGGTLVRIDDHYEHSHCALYGKKD